MKKQQYQKVTFLYILPVNIEIPSAKVTTGLLNLNLKYLTFIETNDFIPFSISPSTSSIVRKFLEKTFTQEYENPSSLSKDRTLNGNKLSYSQPPSTITDEGTPSTLSLKSVQTVVNPILICLISTVLFRSINIVYSEQYYPDIVA